ncbi:hypothetical protein GEV33_001232 [Tenebrio molitor]|uniref:Odorant receptor n=1 Tax=Tenebrio molitor TaxID=7067 RepID=A0A8J6LG93_TENMO|nr:hypothetical protein GEV33_001232 [Tenebrio molitor]
MRKIKTIKRLLKELESEEFQPRSEHQKISLEPTLKSWKVIYAAFWIVTVPALSSVSIFPIIDGSARHHRLPFWAWYPYDTTTSPNYEITYFYQVVGIWFLAICNINMDTLMAALMMYTVTQCDILCDNLRNIKSGDRGKQIIQCVQHHKKILSFAQSSNKVFNEMVLGQFFTTSASLALGMFEFTLVQPLSSEGIWVTMYLSSMTVQIFLYCWFGNLVEDREMFSSFAKNSNRFFNEMVLGQFFTTSASMALGMFELTLVEPLSSECIWVMMYVGSVTVQIFLYCWFVAMNKFDWKSTIRTNLLMLRLTGLWPESDDGYKLDLYTFYAICAKLLADGNNIFQTAYIFEIYTDLQALASTFFVLCTYWLASVKVCFFVGKIKIIKSLMKELDCEDFQPRSEHQKIFLEPTLNSWRAIYAVFWTMVAPALLFLVFFPVIDGSARQYRLPFWAWYPYDTTTSPNYEISYFHQVFSIWFLAICNLNMDTLMAALMMYTVTQCDILCDNLRNIKSGDRGEKIIECVEHHKKILRYVPLKSGKFQI